MHCITPVKNENQLGVYGKMKKKKLEITYNREVF